MKIYINQVGYLPQAIKHAVVETSEHTTFALVREDNGEICKQGDILPMERDSLSGIIAGIADFSDWTESGLYRLEVTNGAGTLRSETIHIGEGLYQPLTDDVLKALYYQRCGCELTEDCAGKFTHKACHTADAVLYEDPSVKLSVTGGWHDAGDFGRYITPAAIAVSHMLWAYERMPEKFTRTIRIPESGNGTPDILNEAHYELRWMMKMQRADGGVYHKVTTHYHAPFIMPELDTEELIVLPVSSMATAMFSASLAQAAHVYRPFEMTAAKDMLMASLRSYIWLMDNEEFLPFRNPSDCRTGEYGHRGDRDHRLWAAIETLRALYAFTLPADQIIANDYRVRDIAEHCRETIVLGMSDPTINKTSFGWGEAGGLAMLGIIYSAPEVFGPEYRIRAAKELVQAAAGFLELTTANPFEVPMAPNHFFWGSNMAMMCRGMLFLIAYDLTQDKRFEQAALGTLDYLLGKNVLDFSYVSGYGYHCLCNPHNRPTVADGYTEIMPGWVAGGPNGGYRDPFAVKLLGEERPAPMASYVDDWMCYSLNEIAIYWNTPTLFVAAYFS